MTRRSTTRGSPTSRAIARPTPPYELENTLIATNATLLGQIVDANVADALASVVSMESHHAAYLAERSGRGGNLDALFTCTGTPLVRAVVP